MQVNWYRFLQKQRQLLIRGSFAVHWYDYMSVGFAILLWKGSVKVWMQIDITNIGK